MARRRKKIDAKPYLALEVTTIPADEERSREINDALVRLVCARLRAESARGGAAAAEPERTRFHTRRDPAAQ